MVCGLALAAAGTVGLALGSSDLGFSGVWRVLTGKEPPDSTIASIVWNLRFPRVMLAAVVGATLSLGGLVFQALLRNPLAEPYILGISGGSAVGAIAGILLGMARAGIALMAFSGSAGTLLLVLVLSSGRGPARTDTLLLAGVMVNAFCSAVIMFLVSLTQDARLHNILFWIMGDLSMSGGRAVLYLALSVAPCMVVVFVLARPMNLLLLGQESAAHMGVNVRAVTVTLLLLTSFMVSATVSHCGLVGFVGLVMPHLFRMVLGPDHRVLVPTCLLGGGTYMVVCDLIARTLPEQGEMPVGVVTALVGAPLFVVLLKRSAR